MSIQVYCGSERCTAIIKSGKNKGKECENGAYFSSDDPNNKYGKYLCGLHSKGLTRIDLPKRSQEEYDEIRSKIMVAHNESCEKQKNINLENYSINNFFNPKLSVIVLYKIRPWKKVNLLEGFINVFPNYKHQDKKDGYGCSSLSPMTIGPIFHGQPDLPPAKNLQNFQQFSQKFKEESFDDFKSLQIKGFEDETPYIRKQFNDQKKKLIPEYFVWIDQNKVEHKLDDVSSRQFYCNFYERNVRSKEQYNHILTLAKDGYNLRICGYDAHDLDPKKVEETYLDKSYPFGHERVLITMLWFDLGIISDLPWIKHKTFEF